jgi:hypothetical protein
MTDFRAASSLSGVTSTTFPAEMIRQQP